MKITVNLNDSNTAKMLEFVNSTGKTKTDFVNLVIGDAVVIGIAESKEIAAGFMKLRNALERKHFDSEDRKEVERVCRSCGSLMEEIERFRS